MPSYYRSKKGYRVPKSTHDHTKIKKHVHKIRSTCRTCNSTRDTKNKHRFHGYGSFAATHHTYCAHNCCAAQNDPSCYIEGQEGRYRKKKRKAKR